MLTTCTQQGRRNIIHPYLLFLSGADKVIFFTFAPLELNKSPEFDFSNLGFIPFERDVRPKKIKDTRLECGQYVKQLLSFFIQG